MKKNSGKKFFKGLLATASALAVITGASNAMGDRFQSSGVGPVTIANNKVPTNASALGVPGSSWTPNDSFFWSHPVDLTLGIADGFLLSGTSATVGTLDLHNIAGRTITVVRKDSSVGSIIDSSGKSQTAELIINNGLTFTLTDQAGKDFSNNDVQEKYTGLGGITLGSGGGGAVLVINSNAILSGTIDSDARNNGIIKVGVGKTVVLNKNAGEFQDIGSIQLLGDGSAITVKDVYFSTAGGGLGGFQLTGNSTVTLSDGKKITGTVSTTGVGTGTLNIAATGTGRVTGAVGGVGHALALVTTGTGAATFDSAVTATNIKVGGAATFTGAVNATGGITLGAGAATFSSTVTGNITGGTGEITTTGLVTGDVTVGAGRTFTVGGGVTGTTSSTGAANIAVAAGRDMGAINTPGGTASFAGTSAVSGSVGTAAAPLATVTLNGNNTTEVGFDAVLYTRTLAVPHGSQARINAGATIEALTLGHADSFIVIEDNQVLEFTGTALNTNIDADKVVLGGDNATVKFNAKAGNAVTVTVTGTLDHAVSEGILILNSEGVAAAVGGGVPTGSTLTIQGGTLGNVVQTLKEVRVTGDQRTIIKSLVNTDSLTIAGGAQASLTNQNDDIASTTIGRGSSLEYKPSGGNMNVQETKFTDNTGKVIFNASGAARTFTLTENIDPGAAGRGIVILGGGDNTATLDADGTRLLGTGANHIAELRVVGNNVITKRVDITNVNLLNITAGATLTSNTNTALLPASVKIGDASGRGTLIVDSAGAAATLGGSMNFGNKDSLLKLTNAGAADATFTLATSITAGAGNNLQGNFEINAAGSNAITIAGTGTIGTSGSRLNTVTVSGTRSVTISPAIYAGSLAVTNTGNVTLGAVNGDVTVSAGNLTTTGVVTGDVTVKGGTFAPNGGVTGTTTYAGAVTINVADGKNMGAINTPSGTLNIAGTSSIGAVGKTTPLALVTTGAGSVTFTDIVNATNIRLGAGSSTFNGAATGTQILFTDLNSRAVFGSQSLTASLASSVAGNGSITFRGTTVESNVGTSTVKMGSVTFAGGATSTIKADIYANAIKVDGGVALSKNATFGGAATFGSSSVTELGTSTLTLTGNTMLGGRIKTGVGTAALGSIVAGAGSNISSGSLMVEVHDKGLTPSGAVVKLVKTSGGGALSLNTSNIQVVGGAFEKWSVSVTADELILTNTSMVKDVLTEAVMSTSHPSSVPAGAIEAFANVQPGTQGAAIADLFDSFMAGDHGDMPVIGEAFERLVNTTNRGVVDVSLNNLQSAQNGINGRLISFSPAVALPIREVATGNEVRGIAAGDSADSYGVWLTPFYSKNSQKTVENSAGYNSAGFGGTLGFDTKISEESIVGLAFSAADTNVKHKDFKSGDRTKIRTLLFSAYTNYQFDDSWFGQGVFSIGSSAVKNKESRRISVTELGIAQSKYSAMTFAVDVLGGYNHLVNNQMVVTPMFGLGYNRVNSFSYEETGDVGPQLLNVKSRANNKLDLVGGLRLSGVPFITENTAITPEIHGFVRYNLIGKSTKTEIKVPGLDLPTTKSKTPRIYYSVGTSLKATHDSIDYGVAVDGTFANKYVSVTGSVNLRVNF